MKPTRTVRFGALAPVLMAAAGACAQWSSDPANNLMIADLANAQAQPKIGSTADGGCFVTWFDNRTGGYDVYAQRLSAGGLEQFPHNGVLVCDRGVSSTVDYDMIVDSGGNAVTAYNDDQVVAGTQQISVSKISPSGTIVWKTTISSVTNATSLANPKVTQLSDGSYAVAYTSSAPSPGGYVVQRLDASGTPLFSGSGLTYSETGHILSVSDIKAGDNGSYIVLWIRTFNTNFQSSKYLLSMKYDGSGNPLWTPSDTTGNSLGPVTGVIVYMPAPGSTYTYNGGSGTYNASQGGSIQNGYQPTMIADGSGGAVYSWYENAGPRDAYLQHIPSNGIPKFQLNGITNAFTGTGRIRLSAGGAYDPVNSLYYVASSESSNPTQGNYSVIVQKFDTTGARVWGDTGVLLMPQDNSGPQGSFVQCQPMSDGVMTSWIWENSSAGDNGALYAAFTHGGASPTTVWNENVSTQNTAKSRLVSAVSTQGFGMLAFGNGPSGSSDIAAVRVNVDGSLGNPACYANCDGSTSTPLLNVSDFTCFLQKFALGDAYANCDGSTSSPTLNVADFTCFLQKFAQGCN